MGALAGTLKTAVGGTVAEGAARIPTVAGAAVAIARVGTGMGLQSTPAGRAGVGAGAATWTGSVVGAASGG